MMKSGEKGPAMYAKHPEQESSLFPVTTLGFSGFILGGLHVLALTIFFAIWSTQDELIGSTPLTTAETAVAVISVVVGLASAATSIAAILMSGERSKVQYSVLALGFVAPALLLSLLV